MLAIERHNKILEILKSDGAAAVSDLSTVLEVTEETVRRDLEKLEKNGELIRTHGGAVCVDQKNIELSYKRRIKSFADEKILIAKEAAKHIAPFDTVFIDASTTAHYLAEEIKHIKLDEAVKKAGQSLDFVRPATVEMQVNRIDSSQVMV